MLRKASGCPGGELAGKEPGIQVGGACSASEGAGGGGEVEAPPTGKQEGLRGRAGLLQNT